MNRVFMHARGEHLHWTAWAALALVLSGCTATTQGNSIPASGRPASGHHRPLCSVKVWASAPGAASVIGYTASASTCTTLTSGNGIAFGATYGLATDGGGYLYVADPANARVVVFSSAGNYWSTLQLAAGRQPEGVCVSRLGVVGVTNADGGATENVDFFTSKGTQNSVSAPSGSAVGQTFLRFCAFDKRGDFFTDYHTQILYLRYSNVDTAGATLQICSDPVCTTGDSWSGMYSHKRSGSTNTLSVASGTAYQIDNMTVSLGAPNQLTFAPWTTPTTALTNYPPGDICQVAPTTGQTNSSRLYIADCGTNVYSVQNVNTGGVVALFASQPGSFGVATHPTGQY
jgi:hypothetical protein